MTDSPDVLRLINSDGKAFPVTASTLIGRGPDCDIQIDESGVSRHHAKLEVSEGKTILKDLESRNGTFLNDSRIEAPAEIQDGDRIRIHNALFTVRSAASLGEEKTAVFEGGPATVAYDSLQLYSLVRIDNNAEVGLNRSLTIGREGDNDIVLVRDSSASLKHAKVEMMKGQVVLTDMGSSNGTWVNGVRITTPVFLSHGDKIRIGNTVFRLREGEKPLPPAEAPSRGRGCWLAGCGSLLAMGMFVAILLGGISLWPQIFPQPSPAPTITPTPQPTATPNPTDIPGLASTQQAMEEDIALRALVLVRVRFGSEGGNGSGSLLDSRGYILTNFHVVGDTDSGDLYDDSEKITVGLNWEDPSAEPDTFYLCEIVKGDPDYDLALLHITGKSNGDDLPPDLVFPTVPIGDSDLLHIGDLIAVLGYPGLGHDTPTFTRGTVAGFLEDVSIDQVRGWIKTDTEINPGNSGGMAINIKGELIGVPTLAYFNTEVTGKISHLRPINLARDIIAAIP
jgi:pSer/pThr/pTyr-binding forkhead associated (FHA) protein/S1-C subfamily serine protease